MKCIKVYFFGIIGIPLIPLIPNDIIKILNYEGGGKNHEYQGRSIEAS